MDRRRAMREYYDWDHWTDERSLPLLAGGKPSKGTSRDGRLKANKGGKPAPKPAFPGARAPFKPAKRGGK